MSGISKNAAYAAEALYKYELPKYLQLRMENEKLQTEYENFESFCSGRSEEILYTAKVALEQVYGFKFPEYPRINAKNYQNIAETFEKNCKVAFQKMFGTKDFTREEDQLLAQKKEQLEKNFPVVSESSAGKNPFALYMELIEGVRNKINSCFKGSLVDIKRRKDKLQEELEKQKSYIKILLSQVPEGSFTELWDFGAIPELTIRLQDLVCDYIAEIEGSKLPRAHLYYSMYAAV